MDGCVLHLTVPDLIDHKEVLLSEIIRKATKDNQVDHSPFQLLSQPSCGFSFKGIVERAFWFDHASKPEYASTKLHIFPHVQDMSIAADMLLLSIKRRVEKLGSMLLG
ncbi:hypothetical protein FHS15_004989 [Paenibacillus castaneae]|nr:hypothetical protein [Paenibacillus castaneae]